MAEQRHFRITLLELRNLMEARKEDAALKVKAYGGVEGLADRLRTSLTDGIPQNEVDLQARKRTFGSNVIPTQPPKPFWLLVFEALKDATLIILMVSATIAFILWAISYYVDKDQPNDQPEDEEKLGWIDSVAIYVAIMVVAGVTAFNDWSKERQFRGLQKQLDVDHNFSVIRGGKPVTINVAEIVVGDVCQVKYGDLLPADGVIIQCHDLRIDESTLTGESDHVHKSVKDPMLLAGTHVMEGSGKMLVTAVGVNSQSGIIFTLLGATKKESLEKVDRKESSTTKSSKNKIKQEEENTIVKSVLQAKLMQLAINIGFFGLAAAVLTTVILIIRYCIIRYGIHEVPFSWEDAKDFVQFLIIGITVLVLAVPEGLPLAVTLSLIYSCIKMMKDHNLVRHLDACETMGNATAICSDKTGTLTTNRMSVEKAFILKTMMTKPFPKMATFPEVIQHKLAQAIAINSSYASQVVRSETPNALPDQLGNKTECALLGYLETIGGSYQRIRNSHPEDSFVKVYTFNSARKSMSTVIKLPNGEGWRLFTKGASEIILDLCGFIMGRGGQISQFTAAEKQDLNKTVIMQMANEALRTICVAYKDFRFKATGPHDVTVTAAPNWSNENYIVSGLTCLAIFGIEDPVRDEVPDAIRQCQRAGIVVRMVTGDNLVTAKSIATKCGIIAPGDGSLVMEGKDFNQAVRDRNGEIQQELIDRIWPRLRVLARSSPTDKYVLVKGIIDSKLSANREVVAVTGDGTNDGPALKKADVGFAMGIAGTDVAKEASDIILTDDNFTSIVKAVMWGRKVYDSIAKFVQFQLTVNIVAVTLAVIGSAAFGASPLKAVQMLWVNLIMDTMASLALATELPTMDLLNRKPYGRTKSLVSVNMFKNMVGQATFQLIILFIILFGPGLWNIESDASSATSSTHFTFVFNVFVFMTMGNEINARKIHNERNPFKGIFSNVIFVVLLLITLVCQVLIITFGGMAFHVVSLELEYWLWSIAFFFAVLGWGQVLSSIPPRSVKALQRMIVKRVHKARRRPTAVPQVSSRPSQKPSSSSNSKSGPSTSKTPRSSLPEAKSPAGSQTRTPSNGTSASISPPPSPRRNTSANTPPRRQTFESN